MYPPVGLRLTRHPQASGLRPSRKYLDSRYLQRITRRQQINDHVIRIVISRWKTENLDIYRIAKILYRTTDIEFRTSISALIETQRTVKKLIAAYHLVMFLAKDHMGFDKVCYRPTNILEKLCHLEP